MSYNYNAGCPAQNNQNPPPYRKLDEPEIQPSAPPYLLSIHIQESRPVTTHEQMNSNLSSTGESSSYYTRADEQQPVIYSSHSFTKDSFFDETGIRKRHGFIRKVYGILSIQLLVTFGMTLGFTYIEPVRNFVQTNQAVMWSAIILSFVFLIAILCCGNAAKVSPYNYILLSGFTLTEGYLVGTIASMYTAESVVLALVMTIAVTLGLTIFAIQTKYDFTGFGPYLFGILMVFVVFGFMNLVFCYSGTGCKVLDTVYAAIGALIFSVYIIYDTQLIVGGDHKKYQFDESDYVFAALALYLDIINLFLYLLRLFGKLRDLI